MPKGGRSMTAEKKNKILELSRQGIPAREITSIVNCGLGSAGRVVAKKRIVAYYTDCPNCGKSIPHNFDSLGRRQRVYCCEKCRQSKAARKTQTRICLNCGKPFLAWNYQKAKFCCHGCYVEHRYGKRLQNKSS